MVAKNNITTGEVDSIIAKLEKLPASDLYESNKTFCKWLSDGFLLKREVLTRERGMVAGSAAQGKGIGKDSAVRAGGLSRATKWALVAISTLKLR